MSGVDKIKDFLFTPQDNFVDKWIKQNLFDGHDTLIDMAKAGMKKEWNNFWFATFDDLLAILAIAAVGYIFFHIIKIMFFSKNEDFTKLIFGYFVLLLIRVFHTVFYFKFGM